MEVSMNTSQFRLPEANQALKQGQNTKNFGFKNVGQKSEKESEFGAMQDVAKISEKGSGLGFQDVGQKSEKESEFGAMQDVGKISEKGNEFGFQDDGQKGGTINVFA